MQRACAEEGKDANVSIAAPLRAQESGESRNSLSNIFQYRTEKPKPYGIKNRRRCWRLSRFQLHNAMSYKTNDANTLRKAHAFTTC
jgi:hypothetical protein